MGGTKYTYLERLRKRAENSRPIALTIVFLAVVAGLAGFVGNIDKIWQIGRSSTALHFEGEIGNGDTESDGLRFIKFLMDNEGKPVTLDIGMTEEQADTFSKPDKDGDSKVYFLEVTGSPTEDLKMDLSIKVGPGADFFFSERSNLSSKFRGSFRVSGCAQTGTGWFDSELRALPGK